MRMGKRVIAQVANNGLQLETHVYWDVNYLNNVFSLSSILSMQICNAEI